jgi:hypothetical protein
MVDPQFAKRVDAKSAVCLTALAAGVGAYVRGIGEAVEAKISPEMRSRIFDCIFPLMLTEYGKFWPNRPPEMFEYTKDRDGVFVAPHLSHRRCLTAPSMRMPPEAQVDRKA